MMTWEAIGKRIAEMTPEQLACPAGIGMNTTGEIAHIQEICLAKEFNGVELPNHLIVVYDGRSDYP